MSATAVENSEVAVSATVPDSLRERFIQAKGQVYLTGLQAIVRVLYDQRRADRRQGLHTGTFVSGYPGSPVGGLDIELVRQQQLLRDNDIFFVPGLNEDLAATAVFGTQLAQELPGAKFDGVMGLWFGKAPGVDRTVDAFRHGTYRGIARNGGVVAVAGDDPWAKSSILPNDSLHAFYALMMPTVAPADVQDVLDLGLHGFMLSRVSGLGVGMSLVADVADSAGTILVGPERAHARIPSVEVDGVPYAPGFFPNLTGGRNRETERLYMLGRLALAREYGRANVLNRVSGAGTGARIGLMSVGKTFLDLMEALHLLGLEPHDLAGVGIRVMKVGLPYPMHQSDLREFAHGLDEVVVLEEKRAFVERALKEALFDLAVRPRVVGKTDPEGRGFVEEYGILNADSVAALVSERLDAVLGGDAFRERAVRQRPQVVPRAVLPIVRAGHFCSGCPHTTSLRTPDGMVVGGGTGCHTMAIPMGREEFGNIVGFTQMGGEGAQWVGTAPFTDTGHFFQNIGDGTFAHSGSLAIRFAVAAGAHMTYKLLYNSAVAMTGGQDVPGGTSIEGTVRLLEAEGVEQIVITTEDMKRYKRVSLPSLASVRHRDDILDVQRELAAVPGVTVLIHDQQCAIEKRRMRRRGQLAEPAESVFINERVCEGCGDCGKKSSCLSVIPVDTEFGRKTQIHQSSCSKDFSCLKGDCPSFLTVKRKLPARKAEALLPQLPDVVLPPPAPRCSPEHFEVHMSGIGGTGVITVNQILGTAAAISGRSVRVLDQFGGSQKAGAVTSHLKVSAQPLERAHAIADGAADALLVFDLLVATEPLNLAKADPARTVAVVSTNRVPTGSMIVNPMLDFPEVPVFARAIDGNTVASENVYVDAQTVAEQLLGDHLATNFFLAGLAFEKGLLPLPAENIEQAIRLNGVAVEMNVAAFRWGRLAVARPELVEQALAARQTPARQELRVLDPRLAELVTWADGDLLLLLERRVADLAEYQSAEYARIYADEVRVASEAESGVGGTGLFACAVAAGLHKLMAYKDEYEVARLHLLDAARIAVEEEFGPGARVYWHLHPPFLRALGFDRKLVLGRWFSFFFRALRAGRRLRGTWLDVFGYAEVRRVERRLVLEYRETIRDLAGRLTADNLGTAIELAALPDIVRGYEHIKLGNVAAYDARRAELLERLKRPPATTTTAAREHELV